MASYQLHHSHIFLMSVFTIFQGFSSFNPLNTELNTICHLLALLGAHHILYVSRMRVNIKAVHSFEKLGSDDTLMQIIAEEPNAKQEAV